MVKSWAGENHNKTGHGSLSTFQDSRDDFDVDIMEKSKGTGIRFPPCHISRAMF